MLLLEDVDGLGDRGLIRRVGGVGHREGEGVLITTDLEGIVIRRGDGIVGDHELVEVIPHLAEHQTLIVRIPLLIEVVIEGEEVMLIDVTALMDVVLDGVAGMRLAVGPELEVVTTGIGDIELPILVYLISRGIWYRDSVIGECTDVEDGIAPLLLRGIGMTVEVNALLVRDTALVHLDEVGLGSHLSILVDLEDKVELLGLRDADGPIKPTAVGLHDEGALHALEVLVSLSLDLEVDSLRFRLGGRGGLGALDIILQTA